METCFSAAAVLRHLTCHPWAGSSCPALFPCLWDTAQRGGGAGPHHHLLSSFCNGYKSMRTKFSNDTTSLKDTEQIDQTMINGLFVFWLVQLQTESSPSFAPSSGNMAQVEPALLILNPLPIYAATSLTPTTWSSSTLLISEENVIRSINLSSTDTFKWDVTYCIKFCHEMLKERFKSHVATALLSTRWKRKGWRNTDW